MTWPGWTDEKVALLRKYDAEGYSGAQIAKLIGAPTRNMIVAKRHRLGLSLSVGDALAKRRASKPGSARPLRAPQTANPAPKNPLGTKHRQSKPNQAPLIWGVPTGTTPKPPAMPVIRADARAYDQTSRKLSCIELTSQTCKFGTHEEGGDIRFCGHQVRSGSVYCAPHAARCVQATSSAKELARSLRRHVAA